MTDDQLKRMFALRQSGVTLVDLSHEFAIPISRVYELCKVARVNRGAIIHSAEFHSKHPQYRQRKTPDEIAEDARLAEAQRQAEELRIIREMRAGGHTLYETAKRVGISLRGVRYICDRNQIDRGPLQHSPEFLEKLPLERNRKIVEARATGLSLRKLETMFGITYERIRQICAKEATHDCR